MNLGVAGAVGQPLAELNAATDIMTRRMISQHVAAASAARFSAPTSSIALGSAIRHSEPIERVECQHDVWQADGSAIVISGTITNIDQIARTVCNEPWQHGDRIERIVLSRYLQQGPEFVAELEGGFAIAIWDARRNGLYLARDRFGIKSLYYAWPDDERFLFASKLTALLASGLVPRRLSHAGIHSYLSFGVVCEPFTAIDGIYPIPPGYWAFLKDGEIEFRQYWSVFTDSGTFTGSLEQAAADLQPLLSDTVRRQYLPGERAGVFLSGGLDSSALAAVTKQQLASVSSISMLLDDPYRSERRYIDLVSNHLESHHVTYSLGPDEALASLDDLFAAMDQPSFDGLNVFTAARAAAGHGFQAAVYGAGGDELFGTPWKVDRVRMLERVAGIPASVSRPAAWLLNNVRWNVHGKRTREWLMGAAEPGTAYDFLGRLFLDSELQTLWRGAVTAGQQLGKLKLPYPEQYPDQFPRLAVNYFLRNQLLRISDWAGAVHGVDVRVPLLDRDLVEWAVRLPSEFKAGAYKPVLAGAVRDLLPDEILTRPKRGFGLPLQDWMRGDLRGEVQNALLQPPLAVAELVNVDAMLNIWDEFLLTGSRWSCSWTLYTLCRWVDQIARIPEPSQPPTLVLSTTGKPAGAVAAQLG